MKIALIVPPLIGHETRGTGVYFRNLAESLERFTDCVVEKEQIGTVSPDVNLLHFPYFDPFFMTLPLLRFKKTVVTVHDLTPIKFAGHFPRGIKGEIKWQLQKRILSGVDAIITDSEASKHDVMTHIGYDSQRIFPVYLAPEMKYFRKSSPFEKQRVRRHYGLPAQFALYVGDVNWNKNVPNVIRAATQARLPLVIVSRSFVERHDQNYNAWKDSLLEAQELATGNSLVKGIGYLEKDDLVIIYELATVLLMPSYYEGFGLPVVEAMASGCPVITSRGGSLSEIIGEETAVIVDPDKVDQIAESLRTVFTNKTLSKKLSEKGKAQAKKFSWEKTARQTYEVYKKVLTPTI